MAELLNHKHCKNCGRALPPQQELCPDVCAQEWKDFQKKRSRTALLFYGLAAFVLLMLFLQLTGRF